jgi:hypothetical protein
LNSTIANVNTHAKSESEATQGTLIGFSTVSGKTKAL